MINKQKLKLITEPAFLPNTCYVRLWVLKLNIMCGIIVINKGEKEITTPRQFLQHFGFTAPLEIGHNTIIPDACLCQIDCEIALTNNNIPFKKDCGDIYVGMLEDVVGDDD